MMDLDALSAFVRVAELGSVTAAAASLELPKSTVSRRIKALEQALHTRLMQRTTRRIELTDTGRHLFERCQPLLEDLQQAQVEVTAMQTTPRGLIRVQMPLAFFSQPMGELVCEFVRRYPEIELYCGHYAGAQPDPAYPAYPADLTFVWHELPLPASDLIVRPLMSVQQGIFYSPHCVRCDPGDLDGLSQRTCIRQSGESLWHFRSSGGMRSVEVSGPLVLDSPHMRLQAAVLGQGLVKLPRYLCDPALRAGTLKELDPGAHPLALQVSLLYHSRVLPRKVRVFVDFFQSQLGVLRSYL